MLGSTRTPITIFWTGLLHVFLTLTSPVLADYDCVCNYKVETQVYQSPDATSAVVGYMYEFDCKPAVGAEKNGFHAIMYTHMTGYVAAETDVTPQICPGSIPDADKLTTMQAASTSTTTPKPASTTIKSTTTTPKITTTPTRRTVTVTMTTTPKPSPTTTATTTTPTPKATTPKTTSTTTMATTTTPKMTTTTHKSTIISSHRTTTTRTTTMTTTTQTPMSTSTPPIVPEGHIELCPNGTKTDISYNKGFLGQYGEFCYEYVPYKTQWKNAERHCALVSSGHLTHVEDNLEQDYLLRFLRSHNHSDTVWIGLTDSDAEGTWQWSSGVPVGFKNFTAGYTQHTDRDHKLNDCVVLEATGSWLDLPCGVQLVLGTGFGEAHSYVCQYNLTSKPPGLFEGFLPGFVVG